MSGPHALPEHCDSAAPLNCPLETAPRCDLVYFHQECPACGRTARILVRYLGSCVTCSHCRRPFTALDPGTLPKVWRPSTLERAEQLLRCVEEFAGQCDN